MTTKGYYGAQPGTQLGGSPFNHSQSADTEAEYDRLRDLARQEHDKMSNCLERAHAASSASDPTTAHALSLEATHHKTSATALNARASAYIFLQNNPPASTPSDTIDLHGQFVAEAADMLEARIRDAQARGQDHLHVVVGRGIHSPGHVQKLKPRVEDVCRELGLAYSVEENEGRIYVDLRGGGGAHVLPQGGAWQAGGGGERQQPDSQHMAYQHQQQGGDGGVGGFQGRPGQQEYAGRYQGQQHQQQQQPQYGKPAQQFGQVQQQQKDDPLTGCFKKCCVVM